MNMKAIAAITLAATLVLAGCGGASAGETDIEKMAKDNVKRAEQYHKLANSVKMEQAKLQGFIADWLKVCQVKNMELKMQQDGDPACVEKQAPPPAPPQASPTPPQPDPGVSQPSTTKTPITPAKK